VRPVFPSLLLFGLINGFTFGVDLALLSLLHGHLAVPLPVAITIGYAVAFALAFVLNKRFNFRSREPAGPEVVRYVGVVAINFVVLLLGVTTLLADVAGVQYQVARLVAGACEGLFMFCAMRWFVFGRTTIAR
jgi:putative flippase GtrA